MHDGIGTPASAPPPDQASRDASERLVALAWDRSLPGAGAQAAHWLVAIDGSAGSLQALTTAARLVAADGGRHLDLVYVHPWLSREAAERELAPRGWTATAPARAWLDQTGIGWRLHVLLGEAAGCILALAQRLGSLGIVLGSRGMSPTESLLLGSVASKVVYGGHVPVLVVR